MSSTACPPPSSTKFQAQAQAEALRRQREQTRAEFEKTVLNDLSTAQLKEGELKTDTDKGVQHVSLMTLKAPIAGVVQQLSVHTVGGVVTPAQSLLVLAPDAGGGLVVEAHIQNKDIGFVKVGQEAQVKIETFSFTRYGLIHGRVLDVSRDSEAGPGPQQAAAKAAGSAARPAAMPSQARGATTLSRPTPPATWPTWPWTRRR